MQARKRCLANMAAGLLGALLVATAARADMALTTLDNPGGGKIVFGQAVGQTTEAGAMGAVLRAEHNRTGERPQISRLFQVRGSNSVAAFFTTTNHAHSDVPVAGLVIVSQVAPDRVEVAVLSDEASRFGTTINPMLKRLLGAWHPAAAAQPSAQATAPTTAPAAGLHPVVLPDRSASVSLPDGWKVTPQSGGGTIIAQGPNGEAAVLGYPLGAMNSNDPRVQRTMQFAEGPGHNTVYARALYYPYGGDLAKTFFDLLQMVRRQHGAPPASFQLSSQNPVPAAPGVRCAHLTGHLDAQDGIGLKEFDAVFCSGRLTPMGHYMNLAYQTAVPVRLADAERATMGAIMASFSVDMNVVNGEAVAIAAPVIGQIHEIGRRAAQQADIAHAAADAQRQQVEQRWDSQDRQSQAFSNYLLDQTVIQDNQNGTHGTVWNQTANSLVRNDPQRYGYVDKPNFWKGVDY